MSTTISLKSLFWERECRIVKFTPKHSWSEFFSVIALKNNPHFLPQKTEISKIVGVQSPNNE
jgi:hypothetical protein